jgi:electron transport complex protein RnfE
MGIGFGFAIVIVSVVREILGTGKLMFFGMQLFQLPIYQPLLIFVLAPGALLTLGLIFAFISWLRLRKGKDEMLTVGCSACSVKDCQMRKSEGDE